MNTQHFINNTWVDSIDMKTLAVINPANEETITQVSRGSKVEVDQAVASAKAALQSWKDASGTERARYLEGFAREISERREHLIEKQMLYSGKPREESELDIDSTIMVFEYYAKQAIELDNRQNVEVIAVEDEFISRVRFEAIGVVGLILPWNFPLITTAWKLAPALACGNTVVLKPSEVTPLIELELADIAEALSLPKGVLNIVIGTGQEVGQTLSEHNDIRKISFTGSTPTGKNIMKTAASSVKNITLELGGKSPIIVFGSADIDKAVEMIIGGIFYNAGQCCNATSRLLVQKDIANELIDKLITMTEKIVTASPSDSNSTMGPLINQQQYDKVMSYIEIASHEGLERLCGGTRVPGLDKGYFIKPTIYNNVPTSSRLWNEEIFGPILCIREFEDEKTAIELANDTVYGLAASVVSEDAEQAQRVCEALEAGHIFKNVLPIIAPETSWGGFKQSGIGRELGPFGMASFSEVKHITGDH